MEYKLAEQGSVFATRARGTQILGRVEVFAAKHAADQLILDFGGVSNVSYSFIDEFLGRLSQRSNAQELVIRNAAPFVQEVIEMNNLNREFARSPRFEVVA